MIQLNSICLSFGQTDIFDHITALFRAQKIGVVGRNGAGKSTLLKAIAGLIPLDEGSISQERHRTIAYLPQEITLESDKSIYQEAYTVFDQFAKLQVECDSIEQLLSQGLGDAEVLIERYQELQDKLSKFDAVAAQTRTKKILLGVGFSEERQQEMVANLSMGWKMRLVLAKLLLLDADFYLFDEPTNHLDMVTKEWFLGFLREYKGGFLLVTHDRHFLDKACDYIFELERGNGTMYTGNFSSYIEQKTERQAVVQSAFNRQQREISQKQATIDRFKASASRSRMAQSMMKQLDKIERIEVEPPLPTIKIRLPQAPRAGKIILEAKTLSYGYSDRALFADASCEIHRGQKVALIGANGIGKSTFFNLLTQKLTSRTGSVNYGYNVTPVLFEQDQASVLTPTNTIFEEIIQATSQQTESTIRALLGAFLFSGDDIDKKISVLSGGERNRVAMVKIFLQNANFLILDEPTNHLDLYAKDVLLQALQNYDGTLLFVSHDYDFINRLASHIIELTPKGIISYPGTYEEYVWQKKQQESAQEQANAPKKVVASLNSDKTVKGNLSARPAQATYEERKEMRSIEARLEKIELEIAKVSEQLSVLEYGSPQFVALTAQAAKLHEEQAVKTKRWEQLMSPAGN